MHPKSPTRPQQTSGFTLLELVLVMVIITTTLSMASLSLRGFFASRETFDAARQFVSLAHYARAQAAAEGRTYRLNLDAAEGRYWLTAGLGGAFDRLTTEFGRDFLLPEGAQATWEHPADAPERPWIEFHPDGRSEVVRILFVGRTGDAARIVCKSPAERFAVVVPDEGEML